jgi:hypothetical protein
MLTVRVTGYNFGDANTNAAVESMSTKSLRSALYLRPGRCLLNRPLQFDLT